MAPGRKIRTRLRPVPLADRVRKTGLLTLLPYSRDYVVHNTFKPIYRWRSDTISHWVHVRQLDSLRPASPEGLYRIGALDRILH